jgi:hypothetical protein
MNTKIKELMGKALDSKFSHTWTTLSYQDLEVFSDKFAELLLQEVDNVLMNSDRHRRDYFAAKVKEHFNTVDHDWLIRKVPNTKDQFYVEYGTPPKKVMDAYGITPTT